MTAKPGTPASRGRTTEDRKMRFPNFLIIGAQKSGTTTLYRDLLTNPQIFFPLDKEPANLASPGVLSAKGRSAYAHIFRSADADQLCGEASTAYSKLPDITGVAERALEVCGPDLRVLYIVRDPIERIVSQHYHDYRGGLADPDINRAVRQSDGYLMYSRYAMQVDPWLEAFGPKQVRVLRFEEYVGHRARETSRVCEFVGVPPQPDLIDPERAFNRGEQETLEASPWRRLAESEFYRRWIKPRVPGASRRLIRSRVIPPPPPRPDPPSDETIRYLKDRLADDLDRQEALFPQLEHSSDQ